MIGRIRLLFVCLKTHRLERTRIQVFGRFKEKVGYFFSDMAHQLPFHDPFPFWQSTHPLRCSSIDSQNGLRSCVLWEASWSPSSIFSYHSVPKIVFRANLLTRIFYKSLGLKTWYLKIISHWQLTKITKASGYYNLLLFTLKVWSWRNHLTHLAPGDFCFPSRIQQNER